MEVVDKIQRILNFGGISAFETNSNYNQKNGLGKIGVVGFLLGTIVGSHIVALIAFLSLHYALDQPVLHSKYSFAVSNNH